MQSTTIQERMAGNTRQSHLSFHAAEAGISTIEAALPLAPVDCSSFIDDFLAGNITPEESGQFTTPNVNELPAQFESGYCGPMKKSILDQGDDTTLTGERSIEVYTIVSIGRVGQVETQLVSTFAVYD